MRVEGQNYNGPLSGGTRVSYQVVKPGRHFLFVLQEVIAPSSYLRQYWRYDSKSGYQYYQHVKIYLAVLSFFYIFIVRAIIASFVGPEVLHK